MYVLFLNSSRDSVTDNVDYAMCSAIIIRVLPRNVTIVGVTGHIFLIRLYSNWKSAPALDIKGHQKVTTVTVERLVIHSGYRGYWK